MAAAVDAKIHWRNFHLPFSMARADVPALVELVRLYTQTTDDAQRFRATEAFATRFIEFKIHHSYIEFTVHVVQPLVRMLRWVMEMNEVKTDAESAWNVLYRQAGTFVVPYLQVHCFLLPHLPPAGARRLELFMQQRTGFAPAPASNEWKFQLIQDALAPLFVQTQQQRDLYSTRLLDRLEEGAAAHLPRLPRDLSHHHLASFLLPPAFAHDLRTHPPPPNAAQVARQLAFVQQAEQAAAADPQANAELERRQGVRRRLEQDHKEQEKEKQQKRE